MTSFMATDHAQQKNPSQVGQGLAKGERSQGCPPNFNRNMITVFCDCNPSIGWPLKKDGETERTCWNVTTQSLLLSVSPSLRLHSTSQAVEIPGVGRSSNQASLVTRVPDRAQVVRQ